MSITEIAATGLLRPMVPHVPDSSTSTLPEGATRAIALAALQATTGLRSGGPEVPSQSLTAPPRNRSSRGGKSNPNASGDYRGEAHARLGRPTTGRDTQDPPSTFSGLV